MARPKKDRTTDPGAAEANGAGAERAKLSQREAVKLAMRTKGKTASNDELQAHIEAAFGMVLKKQNIATLKSQIKSEGRRAPTAVKGPEGYNLEDLRLIQELVTRIGAPRVRDMVDLFAK